MIEQLKEKVQSLGKRLPRHIAIIMDGNGRWANKKGFSRTEGHRVGVRVVRQIVEIAREVGIGVLTLYTFSTENWQRPRDEIGALMNLLRESVYRELDDLVKNGVRLRVSGDIDGLPLPQRKAMEYAIKKTANCDRLILNLALNYGGRQELVNVVRCIARDVADGNLSPDSIDETVIESHLWTAGLPDPDLMIRTSGEMRISNFLLWQMSYSEFYISEKLWPEFTREDFLEAILDYARRDRRFGGR